MLTPNQKVIPAMLKDKTFAIHYNEQYGNATLRLHITYIAHTYTKYIKKYTKPSLVHITHENTNACGLKQNLSATKGHTNLKWTKRRTL